MKLGIHVKIGKGLGEAAKMALSYGCQTFQMFSRSPRGGKARTFSEKELQEFHKIIEENGIAPVVVHMPYVLNLATSDEAMHEYAVRMIEEDLERCGQLKAQYLVLHVGSHRGAGEEAGLKQMLKGLEEVLSSYEGNTIILLENTSGSGNELGYKFEHIAWLLQKLNTTRVGVCYDTCHAFGAGYDLSSREAVKGTMEQFDAIIGRHNLKVIHCNDSAYQLGSKKDRHAHIGQGLIGREGFAALLKYPGLQDIPFILETPVDDNGGWAENLQILRSLAEMTHVSVNLL